LYLMATGSPASSAAMAAPAEANDTLLMKKGQASFPIPRVTHPCPSSIRGDSRSHVSLAPHCGADVVNICLQATPTL
jgi:hypothetical protein